MDISLLIFLSSGLFLGWSLGSNDAANIFGTAVGSRMVRFVTAAIICAVFVVLGAVIGGAGAAHGLGKLGEVNAIAGSFMVALSAAVTVYGMTKAGLPVSTTQAVVGGIVGWNLFGGFITDMNTLAKIVGTWIAAPILGAIFGASLYKLTISLIRHTKIHIVRLDAYTRIALVLTGALGAYSLGANNIGNVMGVFVSSSPFRDVNIYGWFTLSSIQQLFLLGGLAIAVGVFYSKKVMMTVGDSIMPVNPVGAWVVVMAQSLVLLIFSSAGLVEFVVSLGLPPYPLVPVSSSQAVIGAVIGIGLSHGLVGARQIKWGVLLNIASGWVSTPVIAALISFFFLFFLQNVFQQQVYQEVHFRLSSAGIQRLAKSGISVHSLRNLKGKNFTQPLPFRNAVREEIHLPENQEKLAIETAELYPIYVSQEKIAEIDREYLNKEQIAAVNALAGKTYHYKWAFEQALGKKPTVWKAKPKEPQNKAFNKVHSEQIDYLVRLFHVEN